MSEQEHFSDGQVVKLRDAQWSDDYDDLVPAGTKGTIVRVFSAPHRVYNVEFGEPFICTEVLLHDELELVE